jgi:hypothetical protein
MNRVFKSSRTHSEEEATFQGWNLTFTTTKDHDNQIVNVSVNGNKDGAGVTVESSSPQTGARVYFHGCPYDTVLADAIVSEIDLIFGGEVPSE